jgi:predicted phosphodiesterase
MQDVKQKDGESWSEYKERLYTNRAKYNLTWEEVGELLGEDVSADHLRKTAYGYLQRCEEEKAHNFDKSVMIVNDIHIPYQRDDVLEIIAKHASEITTLIIGGDLMDCESVSSFPKIRGNTLTQELIMTYEFIKNIRKILKDNQEIILIKGNHTARYYKEICKMNEKELQSFINPEILDNLVEGFTLYQNGKKHKYDGIKNVRYIPQWYINVEDKLIVCHPTDFSAVDGKMCEKVSEHFLNKGEVFDVIVMAHTHKYTQMKVSRRQGKYVVENGCMCKPQSYSNTGKLNYTPQDYCYTIIKYNDNEHINYNNIKVYHLDEEKCDEKICKIKLKGYYE